MFWFLLLLLLNMLVRFVSKKVLMTGGCTYSVFAARYWFELIAPGYDHTSCLFRELWILSYLIFNYCNVFTVVDRLRYLELRLRFVHSSSSSILMFSFNLSRTTVVNYSVIICCFWHFSIC